MSKVMVQLTIPVTGKRYDITIPKSLSVGEATDLIAEFFTGTTGGGYMPGSDAVLCDMKDGRIFDVNASVESLGLKNGAMVMMI